jgi:hypothetical protein
MTQVKGPDGFRRIRYTEYVEVISKEAGGRVFECPHCAATFDSFDEAAQLALTQCIAHARACSKKSNRGGKDGLDLAESIGMLRSPATIQKG